MSIFDEIHRIADATKASNPNGNLAPLMERTNAPLPQRELTRQEKTIANTIKNMRSLNIPISVWGVKENSGLPPGKIEAYFVDHGIVSENITPGRRKKKCQ